MKTGSLKMVIMKGAGVRRSKLRSTVETYEIVLFGSRNHLKSAFKAQYLMEKPTKKLEEAKPFL